MRNLAMLVVFFLVMVCGGMAESAELVTIGAVEELILFPSGVRLQARIDTGAVLSSIDACDIRIEGSYVSFSLADRCGGHKMRKKLLKIKDVRTSEGRDQRPVVLMEFCIGSTRLKTRVTLNDRSAMEYPVLIGRNTMRKRFIVDVSRKNLTTPTCVNLNPAIGADLAPPAGTGNKTDTVTP